MKYYSLSLLCSGVGVMMIVAAIMNDSWGLKMMFSIFAGLNFINTILFLAKTIKVMNK